MRLNYPPSAVTPRDISRPASSVAPFAGRALDMTREVSGPTRTLLPQQMEPGAQRGGTGAVSTSFLVSYADSSSASLHKVGLLRFTPARLQPAGSRTFHSRVIQDRPPFTVHRRRP